VLSTSSYAISYHVLLHARGNPTPVMANKGIEENTDGEHESPSTSSRVRLENITLDWDGIRSENLLRLKKRRSSKKGILTRVQNEIKGLMLNSDNYDLVKDRIEEFKQLLQEFKEAHAAYHSQLSDENEIKESDEYYDTAVLLGTDLAHDVGNGILATTVETRLLQSQEDLHPEDSISNAGSHASSKSSHRARKSSSSVSCASSIAAVKRRPPLPALRSFTPSKRKS